MKTSIWTLTHITFDTETGLEQDRLTAEATGRDPEASAMGEMPDVGTETH